MEEFKRKKRRRLEEDRSIVLLEYLTIGYGIFNIKYIYPYKPIYTLIYDYKPTHINTYPYINIVGDGIFNLFIYFKISDSGEEFSSPVNFRLLKNRKRI